MTRFAAPLLLHFLFALTPIHALTTPPHRYQLNRRTAVGWISSAIVGSTFLAPQNQPCVADTGSGGGLDVPDFLRTGQVAMPMGVAGQAGKSRPETGVTLRDGSDVSRNPKTGDVLAEIVVRDKDQAAAVVVASYSSPWPLGTYIRVCGVCVCVTTVTLSLCTTTRRYCCNVGSFSVPQMHSQKNLTFFFILKLG